MIRSVEQLNKLRKSVEIVGAPWKQSAYYEAAEKWLHMFWGERSKIHKYFNYLDLTNVIELAAGHGRHSEIVAGKAGKFVVMDVFEENLAACKKRLDRFNNVEYKKCEGFGYEGVEDEWATSIFCYDAMVHFSPDIVEAYLLDSFRVLKPGGRALYHHSNFNALNDQHYGLNPHARNHMTKDLFAELTAKANLEIVCSRILDWGGVEKLDGLTVVQKPL